MVLKAVETNDVVSETTLKLRNTIERHNPGLLKRFPVSTCIGLFDSYPSRKSYSYVSPALAKIVDDIASSGGSTVSADYLKLLLLDLISHNRRIVDGSNLPVQIKRLYTNNFARIFDDAALDRQPQTFYHYRNDKFIKDLGVCNLRIIPAGAQKLNKDTFPLGCLRGVGLRQLVEVGYILGKLRGVGPVYDMHTDSHDPELLAEFSAEGWRRFYLNAAALMQVQQDVNGLFGIGWFFDPQVPKVSPRLAYLRDLVSETGGRMFRVGPSEGARQSALATSPTRRKLYEDGKYEPTDFLAAWDRKSLIRWAQLSSP